MTTVSDRLLRWAPYALLTVTLVWIAENAWGPLKDPDAWWHLRLGEDFLHQGSLAPPGHWSSFATASWTPTEPLPEVAAALVYRAAGLPGVVWLYVITTLLVCVGMFLVCRCHAAPMPAVVATMLFVAAGQGSFTPRPQLVSYLFLMVLVEAWSRSEVDLRARWWLVPLCWLWSLCHGFWFIGVAYGVLGVVCIAGRRRASRRQLLHLVGVAVGSGLVVLLNPAGLGVVEAPFEVSQFTQFVTEWARPSVSSGPALTVTLMVVGVVAIWLARRESVSWFRALVVISALFWGWYAIRTIVLGALLAAPILAAALQSLIPDREKDPSHSLGRRELARLACAIAVLAALAGFVVPHTADRPGGVPTTLDAQLDELPPGTPVFNAYALGGWLSWRHPGLEQYIDGLITPYTPEHARLFYETGVLAPGWYATVRDSKAPVALIESDSTLAAALKDRGWTASGTDAGYVLLHRPRAG